MIVPLFAIFVALISPLRRPFANPLFGPVFAVLAFGFISLSALAQTTGDVIKVDVGHTVTADSNLFRRSASANPQSDVINATAASLHLDKAYSQQNFKLDVTENLTRYDRFSYLNFNATNYSGVWSWRPSQRLNVSFSADRSKSLALFEETPGAQRNISTNENRAFNLTERVFGGWYLLLGVSRTVQKSEQVIATRPDERIDTRLAGVKYVTSSGNSISATRRAEKGDFLNRSTIPSVTGTGFSQYESELSGNWKLSEKSDLTGGVTHLNRSDNQIGQRDFSGLSGNLGYTWQMTSKLKINVSASRRTAPLRDISFSYSKTDTVSLVPTWAVTNKIAVHVRMTNTNLGYFGNGVVPATGPARKDSTNTVEVGVDWSPLRNLSVNVSLQGQRRSSNSALFEYNDKKGLIGATWVF